MNGRGTTVRFERTGPTYGTALIAQDDSVWIAVAPRWWDLATWLWWWLCPSDQRVRVTINVSDGLGGSTRVRTRVVRVSEHFVRVNGVYSLGKRAQ